MAIGDNSPGHSHLSVFFGVMEANQSSGSSSPTSNSNGPHVESTHTETVPDNTEPKRPRRRRSLGKKEAMADVQNTKDVDNLHIKKGTRKQRRWESILSLLRKVEIEEQDLMPSYPNQGSWFQKLLNDPAKLELWYDFLKKSEAKQRSILSNNSSLPFEKCVNSTGRVSAEECYKRIDRYNRSLLRKSNISPEFLLNLEKEIIIFISQSSSTMSFRQNEEHTLDLQPSVEEPLQSFVEVDDWLEVTQQDLVKSQMRFNFESEWEILDRHELNGEVPEKLHQVLTNISQEDTDFEQHMLIWTLNDTFSRTIAHSVCQYYGLPSHSQDVNGARVTRVLRSENVVFPSTSLTQYLASHSKAMRWAQHGQLDVALPVLTKS